MSHQVTDLLRAWSDRNQEALNQLADSVQAELRRLARALCGGDGLSPVKRDRVTAKVWLKRSVRGGVRRDL